jgi:hypothetical protein
MAAFMSNYAATINAAPAYVVNDIYKRFINPHAEEKTYVRLSYLTTIAFVLVGFLFGMVVESINQVTLWIVSALWGGYTASNILKWYWWRFNGHGYFWGMVAGIGASLVLPLAFPWITGIIAFPYVLGVSLVGCFVGSLTTVPESDEVLMRFYMQVRPWGFWKPVIAKVHTLYPSFEPNPFVRRDILNVLIGIIWQTSLVLIPISLVSQQYSFLAWVAGIVLVTSIVLKFTWWNNLDDASKETMPADFDQRIASARSRLVEPALTGTVVAK